MFHFTKSLMTNICFSLCNHTELQLISTNCASCKRSKGQLELSVWEAHDFTSTMAIRGHWIFLHKPPSSFVHIDYSFWRVATNAFGHFLCETPLIVGILVRFSHISVFWIRNPIPSVEVLPPMSPGSKTFDVTVLINIYSSTKIVEDYRRAHVSFFICWS